MPGLMEQSFFIQLDVVVHRHDDGRPGKLDRVIVRSLKTEIARSFFPAYVWKFLSENFQAVIGATVVDDHHFIGMGVVVFDGGKNRGQAFA